MIRRDVFRFGMVYRRWSGLGALLAVLILVVGAAGAQNKAAAGKAPADGKCVAIVLSGGNADFETVSAACARVMEP